MGENHESLISLHVIRGDARDGDSVKKNNYFIKETLNHYLLTGLFFATWNK